MNLYRLFDEKHHLLYVGISASAIARLSQHTKDKPWAHEIAHVSVEQFETRSEAASAEREAIRSEHPRYNIVHRHAVTPEPIRAPRPLIWLCSRCDDPIEDEDGAITLLSAEMCRFYGEKQRWQQRRAHLRGVEAQILHGDDWDYFPEPAAWLPLHFSCLDEDDSASYEIDVERARTPAHLLDWTAHLLEKSWFAEETNWPDLIRRMQQVNRGAAVDA